MHRNKTSIIFTAVFCLSSTLVANPVLVGEWNWTDAEGTIHNYGAYEYEHQAWKSAASQVREGWHLATITSRGEQDALIQGLDDLQGEYWVGGYQTRTSTNPEDDWAWITGESWNYKNWAKGEPNDAYGFKSEQHLAVWSKWKDDTWLWNDEGACRNITGYVVERTQSVPEPEMMVLFTISILALTALSGINRKMV